MRRRHGPRLLYGRVVLWGARRFDRQLGGADDRLRERIWAGIEAIARGGEPPGLTGPSTRIHVGPTARPTAVAPDERRGDGSPE